MREKNTTVCGVFGYFQRKLAGKIEEAVGWAGRNKDKRRLRIDNFLIIVWLPHSFSLPFTVLCTVTKEVDFMPKRRANGEGNIRKRKDGRWEGRYTVGHDPETGKAIIKNVRGKTQAGDTVKTELIYDREKVRAESCPDFSYISQKLR